MLRIAHLGCCIIASFTHHVSMAQVPSLLCFVACRFGYLGLFLCTQTLLAQEPSLVQPDLASWAFFYVLEILAQEPSLVQPDSVSWAFFYANYPYCPYFVHCIPENADCNPRKHRLLSQISHMPRKNQPKLGKKRSNLVGRHIFC